MSAPQRFRLIAVGASAGGFAAVCRIVGMLPAGFAIPIAVVLHRSKDSNGLAGILQSCSSLRVLEVEDKQPLEEGTIYIAPPDYHLLIDDDTFALSTEERVLYSRPSIDVFFESAADAFGAGVIGVVLTGANTDGSRGLAHIVARGGQALIQDPATAEVANMPAGAKEAVPRARVLGLDDLAQRLIELEQLHRQQVSVSHE